MATTTVVNEKPYVDFVITTYNDHDNLEKCLESMIAQNYPSEKYRILVVDAGSNDGSIELVRKFQHESGESRIELTIEKGVTRSRGRNIGITKSRANLIAVVNSDAKLHKDWLRIMTELIGERTDAAGIASYQIYPSNQGRIARCLWYIPSIVPTNEFSIPEISLTDLCETKIVPNEGALYRKAALVEVGLFDERLNWSEDSELNVRLWENGWKLFVSKKAKIEHLYKSSPKGLFRQQFGYGFGAAIAEKRIPEQRVKQWVPKYKRVLAKCVPLILPLCLLVSWLSLYFDAVHLAFFVICTVAFLFIGIFLLLTLPYAFRVVIEEKKWVYFPLTLLVLLIKYSANIIGFWKGLAT